MSIESIPKITGPAAERWASIPADTKNKRSQTFGAGNAVTRSSLRTSQAAVKGGALLLVGLCSECHGDVARLVEMN